MSKQKRIITEDTPLTPGEWKFVYQYIHTDTLAKAGAGISKKLTSTKQYTQLAARFLQRPNVRKAIGDLMSDLSKKEIATSTEVLEYFTSVMRGEVKDQFGLDAPLAERTNAAKELAKRTVDVDLRKQGMADNQITVTVNWGEGGNNND